MESKLQKAPAYAVPEELKRKAKNFCDLIQMDFTGPISPPDLRGRRYVYDTEDDATELMKPSIQTGKDSDETLESYNTMYDSTVKVKGNYRDGGGEFGGKFRKHEIDKAIRVLVSLPRRRKTNARQGRRHRTKAEGARAALRQSGLPARFWSYAYVQWCMNKNRQKRIKKRIQANIWGQASGGTGTSSLWNWSLRT